LSLLHVLKISKKWKKENKGTKRFLEIRVGSPVLPVFTSSH
jgi:hypothetical protein